MRIVVKFPSHAYGELLADLEPIPPRERAERMRLLASIGMAVLRSGHGLVALQAFPKDTGIANTVTVPGQETPSSGFSRVREKLKMGMDD